jgi:hypothetical protein
VFRGYEIRAAEETPKGTGGEPPKDKKEEKKVKKEKKDKKEEKPKKAAKGKKDDNKKEEKKSAKKTKAQIVAELKAPLTGIYGFSVWLAWSTLRVRRLVDDIHPFRFSFWDRHAIPTARLVQYYSRPPTGAWRRGGGGVRRGGVRG